MAVKYQIPFESNAGVKYRVDIYDPTYTTGDPIALQGGATPFTTEEDSTDDFFTPIRTSTGTLSIVNGETANGTPIDIMEEVVPINNTAYPMRLVKVESESESVVWQGFLSCEAYEQEFTDNVREIAINCNSILAAMDSVEANDEDFYGVMTIKDILTACFDSVDSSVHFDNIYISKYANILPYKVDTSLFFEEKEKENQGELVSEVKGVSIKDIIEKISVLIGLCVREVGSNIYIMRIGSTDNAVCYTWNNWHGSGVNTPVTIETEDLDNFFEWMGAEHKKSVTSGAKSVEVVANVSAVESKLSLPKLPDTGLVTKFFTTKTDKQWVTTDVCQLDRQAFNLTLDYFIQSISRDANGVFTTHGSIYDSDIRGMNNTMLIAGFESHAHLAYLNNDNWYNFIGGATMAKLDLSNGSRGDHNESDGLYCAFLPITNGQPNNKDIAVLKSVKKWSIPYDGILGIHMEYQQIWDEVYLQGKDGGYFYMYIKIGNLYYHGLTYDTQTPVWSAEKHYFYYGLGEEGKGTYPVHLVAGLSGVLEIGINSVIVPSVITADKDSTKRTALVELFISNLEISYRPTLDLLMTDKNENHYLQGLNTIFRDEITINTDIASNFFNHASSHILTLNKEPVSEILYNGVMTRPEIDLLNRMAAHYGAAKRKLTLQVEHPTEPLPLLRVTDGTGADEKTYIPVAESRDYAADTSELTLLEV